MPSHDIASVLATYPEQNPFHMDPPLYNLSPPSQLQLVMEKLDSPAFRAAALEVTQTKGVNPLCVMYGTNPLRLTDQRLSKVSLPLVAYKPPPPLPQVTLAEEVDFLGQLNKDGNSVLFTIRVGDEVKLLKIFSNREPDVIPNMDPSPDEECTILVDRFEQERDAYAHLSHYGVCEKGVVPRCYGWLELSPRHIEQISSLPDISLDAEALPRLCTGPVPALLLEYFPDAVRLTQDHLTEAIADVAMRGLAEIHSAYILHDDVYTRNILLLPGDRVVWVDFDRSVNPSGKQLCRRQDLLYELFDLWNKFYINMLPDKRIGHYGHFEV